MKLETIIYPLEESLMMVDSTINIDELLNNKPGGLIYCNPGAITYIQPVVEDYSRIAGMISDDA